MNVFINGGPSYGGQMKPAQSLFAMNRFINARRHHEPIAPSHGEEVTLAVDRAVGQHPSGLLFASRHNSASTQVDVRRLRRRRNAASIAETLGIAGGFCHLGALFPRTPVFRRKERAVFS